MIITFSKYQTVLARLLLTIFLLESCRNENIPINQRAQDTEAPKTNVFNLQLQGNQQPIPNGGQIDASNQKDDEHKSNIQLNATLEPSESEDKNAVYSELTERVKTPNFLQKPATEQSSYVHLNQQRLSSGRIEVDEEKSAEKEYQNTATEFKINDQYQYEDMDIQAILSSRTKELFETSPEFSGNSIHVLAAVDNIMPGQLSQRLIQEKEGNHGKRILLIPYNLGNYHWVGLLIEINENEEVVRAEYIDSLNGSASISRNLQEQLTSVYPHCSFESRDLLRQKDSTSCGAYTIENLLLAINENLETKELTTVGIRQLHLTALKKYNSAFYDKFYIRQKDNRPTTAELHEQLKYLKGSKNIKFSKQEFKRILAIKKCLANIDERIRQRLWAAFEAKKEYQDEHILHLNAIRETLNETVAALVEGNDKKLFQELIALLFGFRWEIDTPLRLGDTSFCVEYSIILAITELNIELEKLNDIEKNLNKQIEEDEKLAIKLQTELWSEVTSKVKKQHPEARASNLQESITTGKENPNRVNATNGLNNQNKQAGSVPGSLLKESKKHITINASYVEDQRLNKQEEELSNIDCDSILNPVTQPLGKEIIRLTGAKVDVRQQVLFELTPIMPADLLERGSPYPSTLRDSWRYLQSLGEPESLVEGETLKKCLKNNPNLQISEAHETLSHLRTVLGDITFYYQQLLEELRKPDKYQNIIQAFEKAFASLVNYYSQYQKDVITAANNKKLNLLEDLLEYKVTMLGESFAAPYYRIPQHIALKLLYLKETGFRIPKAPGQNHYVSCICDLNKEPKRRIATDPAFWKEARSLYFKNQVPDESTCPLQPGREMMVYQLYDLLGIPLPKTSLIALDNIQLALGKKGDSHLFDKGQNKTPFFLQASWGIDGELARDILENRDPRLSQLDEEAYAKQFLGALLTCPSDGKPGNFIFVTHKAFPKPSYSLMSIDNDEIFADPIKKLATEDYIVHLKSILLTLPQIENTIPKFVQEYFLNLSPELVALDWLNRLHQHNFLYSHLQNRVAYLRPTESIDPTLSVPITLNYSDVTIFQQRLRTIQDQLKANSKSRLVDIFEAVYSSVAKYYEEKRTALKDPYKLIDAVYAQDINDSVEGHVNQKASNLIHNPSEAELTPIKESLKLAPSEAIKQLIATTNLKEYNAAQQLSWIERVAEINIWPDNLHSSWYDPLLLIRMVKEGASERVIKALLEKANANIKACTEKGETVLHAAVQRGGDTALKQIPVLIQLGADLEAQTNHSVTPLELAAEKHELAIFKCLIENGAGEKAIANKISRFYQRLSSEEKEQLIPHITKLTQINPKLGWKISLNELFPVQQGGKLHTVTEGERVITQEAWNQLFDEEGKPKKTNTCGARAVPYVEKHGQRIYVKFEPQLPGTELAVIRLAEHLLGYCAPYCELATIDGIPVLLTQGIPGKTLYKVLKKYPERINLLDPESVSKALILTMLTNPGDGNLGNYIISPFINQAGEIRYRLICIDNEQAFMPSVAKTIPKGWFSSINSLQVKTALYCLELMNTQIWPTVVDKIKNINLLTLLESWLKELKDSHEKIIRHFDSGLIEKYQESKTTVLGVAFTPGMIKQLFTKLIRLQTALNKKKIPTQSKVLEILEPLIAQRYKPILNDKKLNAIGKFKKIENINEENEKKVLTSTSNRLDQVLESRDIPNLEDSQESLWLGKYGPDKALKELKEIKDEYIKLYEILQHPSKLNLQVLKSFSPGTLEELLRHIDLKKITSTVRQQQILEAIKDKELRYIRLKYCAAMTGGMLTSFQLNHLKALDLSGCANLKSIAPGLLRGGQLIMPTLTHLNLDQSGVTFIRLQAVNLKKLSARNCAQLNLLKLKALKPKTIDITGVNSLNKDLIISLFHQFITTFIYLTPTKAFTQQEYDDLLYEQYIKHQINVENNLTIEYLNYLKQTAKKGNNVSQSILNDLALKRNEFAQKSIRAKAQRGDQQAQYILGRIYEQGMGIEQNEDKAAEWYIKAAKQGHWDAIKVLTKLSLQGNIFAQQWVITGAEKGCIEAQYALGQMYANGLETPKNEDQAVRWYIRAANEGHWDIPDILKKLALSGNIFAQNWIRIEAEKEDQGAQYILGRMYEYGIGVNHNEDKAAEWYIKATKEERLWLDESNPRKNLTNLAFKGNNLAQNWIIKKAIAGDQEAQYTLSYMYKKGIGVAKNKRKAEKWHIKTTEQHFTMLVELLKN